MSTTSPVSTRRTVPGRWHEPRLVADPSTESFGCGSLWSLDLFRRIARRREDQADVARRLRIFGY